MAQVLPAPQPRARVYDIALKNHEAVLETESMIAVATSVYVDHQVVTPGHRWETVRFSDPDGSNASERNVLSTWDAREGSVAQGSDAFLKSSTGYRVVNRDPSVEVRNLGGFDVWELGAITDDYIIVHTSAAQDGDEIEFRDRNTFQALGRVVCKVRPVKMVALENEILFASQDGKGYHHFHRMPYPDFSKGSLVKVKITNVPGTFGGISHFGPNFAVASDLKGQIQIVRWADPAKAGKAGIYPVPEYITQWTETDGKLLKYGSLPFSLSEVKFGNKSISFESIGVPPIVSQAWLIPTNGAGLFFKGPRSGNTNLDGVKWFYRLDPTAGHQLSVPPVTTSGEASLRFVVKLDRPATSPVSFDYEAVGVTASLGDDFTATSGSQVLTVGQSEVFIDVPLVTDSIVERPETLELRITGLSGAFCDEPVATGRIIGSGKRVIQEVADDGGAISSTLADGWQLADAKRVLEFAGGSATASKYGFESFIPIPGNGGAYYYAHGSVNERVQICQFDATTGELLEVFADVPRKRDGDTFIVAKGAGYSRYGFFDGLPVINLENVSVREGSGVQTFALDHERYTGQHSFVTTWSDPSAVSGTVNIPARSTGPFRLEIGVDDDTLQRYQQPVGVTMIVTNQTTGTTGTMISYVNVVEDDVLDATASVPTTTVEAGALAAHGNRLWLGQNNRPLLENFKFESGVLKPAPKITLPKNAKLQWYDFNNNGSGQGIAFDGQRVVSGSGVLSQGMAVLSGAASARPKAKIFTTNLTHTSHLLVPGYIVMSRTEFHPGSQSPIYFYDAKNKLARTLTTGGGDASAFGYSMAVAGDILWIAAPRLNGAGGRVEGYSLSNNFSLVRTLVSPEPVSNGIFGFSISSSGPYLVIGEPSTTAPGAAWVYSADGTALLKRLGSGASSGPDAFGSQVTTRGGRILTGICPLTDFYAFADGPVVFPPIFEGHRPVLLWTDINATPKRILPTTFANFGHSSGKRIALLDDCAVFTSQTETTGSLEVYSFSAAASATSSTSLTSMTASPTPAWPAEGALEPSWSFVTTEEGATEVRVELGTAPAEADKVIVEWSGDLKEWTKVADWKGSVISARNVSSAASEGSVLKLTLSTEDPATGFFRLRTIED
ncbi:Calx-beta domain-containing protein [Luteolibacter luteus]|uniref:Calx-beta domain-containing protein n=1 Tax=Luteolibacter luteus TaxID=2728835 RepID=A0A858RLT9_9BACT|nr:Calx-beta domain-containing protein [Luteolibacter luteus]QJE98336.1 hypothetical protein HHL09_21975 [Luteolibacter luteus]